MDADLQGLRTSRRLWYPEFQWWSYCRPQLGAIQIRQQMSSRVGANELIWFVRHLTHWNHSPDDLFCRIMIYNRQSGASIKAVVLDECPGCKYGDLDLTPETFRAIGKLDDGRVKVSHAVGLGTIPSEAFPAISQDSHTPSVFWPSLRLCCSLII